MLGRERGCTRSHSHIRDRLPLRQGDHWAVLIAGSAGYGNYRHQADVCHAYQIMVKSGMKPEQIIVLAADDIANNEENPFPGKLFNKPTPEGTEGVDVYEGCVIDYSGDDVTPDNFVAVLTGDSHSVNGVGSGKVLESGPNSRVFVNFVDHGGVGIIGFPSTMMHAKELIDALQKMSDTSMYKELVFYLEACESGSMFEDLPKDIHIYATTAANAHESSWGTYCVRTCPANPLHPANPWPPANPLPPSLKAMRQLTPTPRHSQPALFSLRLACACISPPCVRPLPRVLAASSSAAARRQGRWHLPQLVPWRPLQRELDGGRGQGHLRRDAAVAVRDGEADHQQVARAPIR